MMNNLIPIAQQIRAECREDYVGLWSIVWRIRHSGVADHSTIIETTLDLVRHLLSEGGIIAGEFVRADDKFHEWKEPPQEIITKIEREWAILGRDPDIGEIAWFVSAGEPT